MTAMPEQAQRREEAGAQVPAPTAGTGDFGAQENFTGWSAGDAGSSESPAEVRLSPARH